MPSAEILMDSRLNYDLIYLMEEVIMLRSVIGKNVKFNIVVYVILDLRRNAL